MVRKQKADMLVFDAPPHLNSALGAIIGVADIAIVPCGPSYLDLIATNETVGLIREIRMSSRL
jgi:chromosome partitioning protein